MSEYNTDTSTDNDRSVLIPGYDNYILFANGMILNCENNRWLHGHKRTDGYIRITLFSNNKGKKFRLHQLLAQAFLPNPENKQFIDHINHIRDDNRLENLRWVTRSENQRNRSLAISNTSGFRGVAYRSKPHQLYQAQWFEVTGKKQTKSFSISRYGLERALRLAVQTRYAQEQLHKYTPLQTPEQYFLSDAFKMLVA